MLMEDSWLVCRISLDWQFKGMRTLILENNLLRVVCLVDKGSDIIEMTHKPSGVDMMWQSPIGYRNPKDLIVSSSLSSGGFLDFYGGGWQDILPMAGGTVRHRGGEWGVHGETPLLAWSCEIEDDRSEEASAHLWVRGHRYPYHVDKHLRLTDGNGTLVIEEKLTNISSQALEFSWLQHPAFGRPLASPGTRVFLKAKRLIVEREENYPGGRLRPGEYVWPHATSRGGRDLVLDTLPDEDTIAEETSYLGDFQETWYALVNPKLKVGFAMTWEKRIFPWVWFWQNYNRPDFPWWGKAWNVALEPCTSIPATFEQQLQTGRVMKIPGNETVETKFTATVFSGLTTVKAVQENGEVRGS